MQPVLYLVLGVQRHLSLMSLSIIAPSPGFNHLVSSFLISLLVKLPAELLSRTLGDTAEAPGQLWHVFIFLSNMKPFAAEIYEYNLRCIYV